MAVPSDPTDPSHLTPDQRLDEIAALATGVRRLLSLRLSAPQKSPPNCLELPPAFAAHPNLRGCRSSILKS